MSGPHSSMSPKFTTRFRNWVESRFGRGRRRPVPGRDGIRVTPCARGCRPGQCQCPLAAAAGARAALTPDSLLSFSSPESAYFTGQSEDSATPLTPATPVTPATPSSGKYFLLQNRDFRPLRQITPEGDPAAVDSVTRLVATSSPLSFRPRPSCPPPGGERAQVAPLNQPPPALATDGPRVTSARTAEFVPVTELTELCCSPRERPKIKTNPWVATSGTRGPSSVSDTSGLDCSLSAETVGSRRLDFQRSYSSGRSSYVSEVSSGSTLAKNGNLEASNDPHIYQPRRDSTYDSMGSPHSEDENDDEDTTATAINRACSSEGFLLHPPSNDSYSDDVTDDEGDSDDADDEERRSPNKRSRGQRLQQERRRSVRDRRRGARRRSETVETPPTGSSPVLPDPSLLFEAEARALLAVEHSFNFPDEGVHPEVGQTRGLWEGSNGGGCPASITAFPTYHRRSTRGPSLLPRSFCPSSEPLRRKVFRGSASTASASPLRCSTIRAPADVVRPCSSLSMRDSGDPHRAGAPVSLGGYSPTSYSPTSFSPVCSPAHQSARACRESLEQKIERLRRQRLIVEARIEEAQAEEVQRRQERIRYLADTLQQRRALLRTIGRYPASADVSPFREAASPRPVSKSRTYFV